MEIKNVIGKYKQAGRTWYQREVKNITKLTVHHTASKQKIGESHDSIMKKHMNTHVNKGWAGLSYHYMIMPDGTTYQINNHSDVTWHDGSNWESIGVCLEGYFHPDVNEKPTTQQLVSLKSLLDHLCTEHPEFPADHNDVRGHRDVMATACPGNLLYPYVFEYKDKLGKVSWGTVTPEPPTSDVIDLKKKLSDKNWNILTEFKKLMDLGLIIRNDSIQSQLIKWVDREELQTIAIDALKEDLIKTAKTASDCATAYEKLEKTIEDEKLKSFVEGRDTERDRIVLQLGIRKAGEEKIPADFDFKAWKDSQATASKNLFNEFIDSITKLWQK